METKIKSSDGDGTKSSDGDGTKVKGKSHKKKEKGIKIKVNKRKSMAPKVKEKIEIKNQQQSIEEDETDSTNEYEHYSLRYFPLRNNWQRQEEMNEEGEMFDEVMQKFQVKERKRGAEELKRLRMFRVTTRALGISPEDLDASKGKLFLPGNQEYMDGFDWTLEGLLGRNWQDSYDPEIGIKGRMLSEGLREVIVFGHRFARRPTYGKKPTFYHRCLVTARELLRSGHEDGQYMPDIELYMESK